jgi:hypothetical protein
MARRHSHLTASSGDDPQSAKKANVLEKHRFPEARAGLANATGTRGDR